MENKAVFKTKFNEYLDRNFKIGLSYESNKVRLGILQVVRNSVNNATFSILFYRNDPVEYEKLFDEWLQFNYKD